MAVGLIIRGAGVALRGLGKAIKASKSTPKKRPKRKKRKSTNDPALTTGLAMTGAASAGLLGKKIMDDKKKPKTIKPKLGLPPKR
tara:strand:- start:124 stop:378 length:255 start_codon:yes stop_codon:yes gene_type:complete